MAQAIYRLKKELPGCAAGTEFYHYSRHEISNGEGNSFLLHQYAGSDGVLCIQSFRSTDDGTWSSVLPAFDAKFRNDNEWFELTENLVLREIEEEMKEHMRKYLELKKQAEQLNCKQA